MKLIKYWFSDFSHVEFNSPELSENDIDTFSPEKYHFEIKVILILFSMLLETRKSGIANNNFFKKFQKTF